MKLCIPYTGISHLTASQVEKGKELELKEQLDALRREHTETLQGACRGSRAPCSPSPLSPLLPVPLWLPVGPWRSCPLLSSTVGLRWGLLPQCPHTGGTQLTFPCRAPESTRAGEAAAGRVSPQV